MYTLKLMYYNISIYLSIYLSLSLSLYLSLYIYIYIYIYTYIHVHVELLQGPPHVPLLLRGRLSCSII